MHKEINYSKFADEGLKRQTALNDIKNWLGVKKYKETTLKVRACQPPMTYAQFRFMCCLGGIEGYPVQAWAEECGITIPSEKHYRCVVHMENSPDYVAAEGVSTEEAYQEAEAKYPNDKVVGSHTEWSDEPFTD